MLTFRSQCLLAAAASGKVCVWFGGGGVEYIHYTGSNRLNIHQSVTLLIFFNQSTYDNIITLSI